MVNTLGFTRHIVSVPTSQSCHCSVKPDIDNIERNQSGCVSIKLLWTLKFKFHTVFMKFMS